MLRSVAEVSVLTGLSKVSIYNKIKLIPCYHHTINIIKILSNPRTGTKYPIIQGLKIWYLFKFKLAIIWKVYLCKKKNRYYVPIIQGRENFAPFFIFNFHISNIELISKIIYNTKRTRTILILALLNTWCRLYKYV